MKTLMKKRFLIPILFLLEAPAFPAGDWRQWGGPGSDFVAADVRLEGSWDTHQPQLLWERRLGNGHSSIIVEGDRVFTLFGGQKKTTVIALRRGSGETLWSYSYSNRYQAHTPEYDGPHSTPLILGDRLFSVGIDAQVHAFDKSDGRLMWRRDLVAEFNLKLPQSGYAASPLGWRDRILLPALGGPGPGAIALSIEDGALLWAEHSFRSSHASPILIDFEGVEQAIFHGMDWIYSLRPQDGQVIWRLRLRERAADNVSFTPFWDKDSRQIILSHGYDDSGVRALRLDEESGRIRAQEVWSNRRLRIDHGNGVRFAGVFLGSNRTATGVLVAVDAGNGELLWRSRIPKVTLLVAGDRLLLLDENGVLHLARPDRSGLNSSGRLQVLDRNAWTVPTLAGDQLFLRDRKQIRVFRLPTRPWTSKEGTDR